MSSLDAGTLLQLPSDPVQVELLECLMGPLFVGRHSGSSSGVHASTAAELAYSLLAFALENEAPIGSLVQGNGRIPGDRAVTDRLGKTLLVEYAIPHSRGALQSSTYRSSYASPQAQGDCVARFVRWADGEATQEDLETFFQLLAEQFARHKGRALRVVAVGSPGRMTFARFEHAVDTLFSMPRNYGAPQQYLLTALLEAETTTGQRVVVTKPLFAPDSATKSAGDIEVRNATTNEVILAYEVSGNQWRTKVPQAIETIATGRAPQVIIAAKVSNGRVPAEKVREAIADCRDVQIDPDEVDLAIVDVTQYCLSKAADLSSCQRVHALRRAAELIRLYHSTGGDVAEAIDALVPSDAQDPPAGSPSLG